MSHAATNWAIKQRGLEPASKLLLWQLADRHNKDTGRCDPSQERLAEDCEMSRASVIRHLTKLEKAGLIRRIKRLNQRTKRQESNSYQLAFDNDFAESQNDTRTESQFEQEPCLKSDESRVSNCDTNPVRELGREPVCADETAPNTHPEFESFWEAYPRPRNREQTSTAFSKAVADGADPKQIIEAARAYQAENEGNRAQYIAFSDNWLNTQRWTDHAKGQATADKPDIAVFWAERIRSGRPVFANPINRDLAMEMVKRGLVSPQELESAGVFV